MPENVSPFLISNPSGVISPEGLDRIKRLAWWDVQHTAANRKLEAATDPTHSEWLQKFNLAEGPFLLRGRIVDSIAFANCHKVQFTGIGAMWCQGMATSALQYMGPREINSLAIGAEVVVMWYKDDNAGIIIGTLPTPQTGSDQTLADFISQQGRSGFLVDAAHNYPVSLTNAALIQDWSAGRPFDATTGGEVGHITETGLLHFLDSFMSASRVDEECGIWHFWHDQMTRLAGHNFQLWTAGYERSDLDDEGEFNKEEGHTPYYWEALGVFLYGTTDHRNISSSEWQLDPTNQGYAAVEPETDQQLAFYRLRDFYGYLGQAHKRILCLPPVISPYPGCQAADTVNALEKKILYPGVFEENLALTGCYAVRSAHSIILAKYPLIPAPKQLVRAEDPNGDKASNYTAAGLYNNSTPPHFVSGEIDPAFGYSDDIAQIHAAGFLDTHAFVFNWVGDHPFYYHTKDWWLPNETDLVYMGASCTPADLPSQYYDELGCHYLLETPVPIPLNVDHRYGETNYYPNHSYFALLDDGGIVLGDGFGAELKMANGHIWLTSPGDINFQAGRDVVSFAGYDLIMRAKHSWDLSATLYDGRLKAHRNLWLGATGDCGGILLESRAVGPVCDFTAQGEAANLGGITLKAPTSMVSICGYDMTFNLTNPDDAEHTILFDAGDQGRLKFRCQFFERFMSSTGAALDFWGNTPDGIVVKGAEFWQDGINLPSRVYIDDNLMVNGCIVAKLDLFSLAGHVATAAASDVGGLVGQITNDASALAGMTNFMERMQNLLPILGDVEATTMYQRETFYNLCCATFSFRAVPEYMTQEFIIFESRWQQIARLNGDSVATWVEESVDSTYPYPGAGVIDATTLRLLNPKYYDVTTNTAVNRGSTYESSIFNAVTKITLDGNYLVIV